MIRIYGLHDADGVVRYIGLTSQPLDMRLKAHLREGDDDYNPAKRTWLQQVRDTVQIVLLDESESDVEAAWLERLWITVFMMCKAPLTNGTYGGVGLLFPTAETRVKLVQSHLGKQRSPEATAKQRAKVLGRPKPAGFDGGWSRMTQEERQRRTRGLAAHRMKHQPLSASHRAKIAASKIGQVASAKARSLMSQRKYEMWAGMTDEKRRQVLANLTAAQQLRRKENKQQAKDFWAAMREGADALRVSYPNATTRELLEMAKNTQ